MRVNTTEFYKNLIYNGGMCGLGYVNFDDSGIPGEPCCNCKCHTPPEGFIMTGCRSDGNIMKAEKLLKERKEKFKEIRKL